MSPVRVVLVEDNDVFREALELMLGMREEIEVVAAVGDGTAAVAATLEHRPDVVLMDYRMPGLDGVEATTQLLAQLPDIRVVALTASADEGQRAELLAAGAVACLGKDEELDAIVAAIQQAGAT
ncbi:MAG TPA: response regulator transcription factor [Gaiellaceae bacterium]|jgi:DNA-binding NarL/FixJ family response regulator